MFGLVASGRLIDTNAQQVDVNKFVFPLVEPQLINHLVVLLTGVQPLDPSTGCSVYLCWANPEPCWQYLGFICNEKPSAIFKINFAKRVADASGLPNPFGHMSPMVALGGSVAQIALSIEPLAAIAQMTAQADTVSHPADFPAFAMKMLENFHNFAASYSVDRAQAMTSPGEQFIPYSTLTKWHEKFSTRFAQDPSFWKQ